MAEETTLTRTLEAPVNNQFTVQAGLPGELEDIIYVPSLGAAIPVPPKTEAKRERFIGQKKISQAYAEILSTDAKLTAVAQSLAEAKVSNDKEAIFKAQTEVRTQLSSLSGEGSSDEAPLDSGERSLVEVYSFKHKKLMIAKVDDLNECTSRSKINDNLFYLHSDSYSLQTQNTSIEVTNTTKKKKPITLKDAFKSLRKSDANSSETGELDEERVHQAWEPVKKSISQSWNLKEWKSKGQISSALVAKAVAPHLAAFFDDDDFEAVDEFVKTINENAKIQWRQYDDRRKALVEKLEEDKVVSPDEWAKILREVKDIWWDGWEHQPKPLVPDLSDEFQVIADEFLEFTYPYRKGEGRGYAEFLAQAKLPPVMWDASIGAQLMRYSMGATVKINNDWKEGKLGVAAEAKASFNLLEAKAEGSFYLPDSDGICLKLDLPTRVKEGHWVPLTDGEKPVQLLPAGPMFAFDKSIVSPKGMTELAISLSNWDIAQLSVRLADIKQSENLKIQIAGHTDAKGSEGYNQTLSERRARSVLAILSNQPEIWLNFFRTKVWDDDDLKLMVSVLLCIRHWNLYLNWRNIETFEELLALIQDHQVFKYSLSFGHLQPLFGTPDYDSALITLSQSSTDDLLDLFWRQHSGQSFKDVFMDIPLVIKDFHREHCINLVVRGYMFALRKTISKSTGKYVFFDKIRFHSNKTIGLGETELKVDTQDANRENRRVEFIPYILTDEPIVKEKALLNFGDIRFEFYGSISAEAGANIELGASVNVAVNKDVLMVAGIVASPLKTEPGKGSMIEGKASKEIKPANEKSKEITLSNLNKNSRSETLSEFAASADAKASAFVGVKAEAGLKAMMQWRPPEHLNQKPENKPSENIIEFLTMAEVGCTATGMAGAGIEGEFKFGFDQQSRRFQIKINASASWGLGFGGSISFSISADYIFEFAKLVHNKLIASDFHFIDLFETKDQTSGVDVYEVFSAIYEEMISRGLYLEAGAAYLAGEALEVAIDVLDKWYDVVQLWEAYDISHTNYEQLIESLLNEKLDFQTATPETKGRLLYRLLEAKRAGKRDKLQDLINWDKYHDIEKAALRIIKEGMNSKRDWKMTLQNMLPINVDGKMEPQYKSSIDKVEHLLSADIILREELLNDEDDQEVLDGFLNGLK